MAITVIPREKDWIEKFTEGMAPYLQAAFAQKLREASEKPKEERAKRKEERDILTGVSKGELPGTQLPKKELQRQFDVSGLGGRAEEFKKKYPTLPPSMQVTLSPQAQQRLTTESPEQAQQRMIKTRKQATKSPKLPTWKQQQTDAAIRTGLNRGVGYVAKGPFGELEDFPIKTLDDALNFLQYSRRDPADFQEELKKYQPDEFGFVIGQEQKGYKYIGNNEWQKL